MPITMKCPRCQAEIKLPQNAKKATCPSCLGTFSTVKTDKEAAVVTVAPKQDARPSSVAKPPVPVQRSPQIATAKATRKPVVEEPAEESEPGQVPPWISPWGAASFSVATLALLQASTLGVRWLTIALAVIGGGLVGSGAWTLGETRKTRDKVWFWVSGSLSGVILLLAVFFPGVLNRWWAIDQSVRTVDPNEMVVIPWDKTGLRDEGDPITEVGANASSEGIRQDDVFIRLDCVKIDTLPDKGTTPFLLVYFELMNLGNKGPVTFDGLSNENHRPVLTDDTNRSYAFVEQWQRQGRKVPVVFVPSARRTLSLGAGSGQSFLMVFEAPPDGIALKLEVPTSAWGRQGTCRFRISGLFDAPVPSQK